MSVTVEPPYRCKACGGKTRFTVVALTETEEYHHQTLGGLRQSEPVTVISRTVKRVTCVWCTSTDIEHIDALELEPEAPTQSLPHTAIP